MTYEEALEITNKSLDKLKIIPEQENISYMIKVEKALEKQIPKKPKISLHGTTDFNTKVTCPSCHGMVFTEKYCRHCGQALETERK